MCNGSSTRTAQGGTIATLRPTSSSKSTQYDLLFSNSTSPEDTNSHCTRATFRTSTTAQQVPFAFLSSCWIVIHRDGDLSASRPSASDPLYRFPISALAHDDSSSSDTDSDTESTSSLHRSAHGPASVSIDLPHALELGFGGKGVIGRRVELVEGDGPRGWMGRTIAEGVIGWN